MGNAAQIAALAGQAPDGEALDLRLPVGKDMRGVIAQKAAALAALADR